MAKDEVQEKKFVARIKYSLLKERKTERGKQAPTNEAAKAREQVKNSERLLRTIS